jgi:hypothetical protein
LVIAVLSGLAFGHPAGPTSADATSASHAAGSATDAASPCHATGSTVTTASANASDPSIAARSTAASRAADVDATAVGREEHAERHRQRTNH